jgi:RNA polymerase sigma-70 factor (ECF subfamily)
VGPLSTAYLAARRAEGAAEAAETDSLEGVLSELVARGEAAHPELRVPREDFSAHLARCGANVSGDGSPVHAEDLYLACACVRGDERAAEELLATYEKSLVTTLKKIDSSKVFLEDVRQRLWDALLVGTMSTPPRLSLYSGHGALGAWLAVAAQRVALMARRHEAAEERARRGAEEADVALQDPELAFIKERYRDQFRAATQKALETLDDRERMIFRLHLVDGVTVERIAGVYGVSHSTISRWFATAREKVIAEVRRVLGEDLQMATSDFDSLRKLIVSQLDVSLSMLPAPKT